jgi:hypothetical protein
MFWEVVGISNGATQSREYNWGATRTRKKLQRLRSRKAIIWSWESFALITLNPLSANVGTNFSDTQRSLGWYSSIAEQGHGVFYCYYYYYYWEADNAISIETGYGLDCQGVGILVPVGSRTFCPPRCPECLWDTPSLLSKVYRASVRESKAVGTWSYPPTPSYCVGQENMYLYSHSPITLHGVVHNMLSTGRNLLLTFTSINIIFDYKDWNSWLNILNTSAFMDPHPLKWCGALCHKSFDLQSAGH